MGVLHPDMKKALKQGSAFAVFEFDDPGGTTHRYAGNWVASDSLGSYKGFIPDGGFGSSPRSVPLRGGRLEPISTSVTVVDADAVIKDLVTGQHARTMRGSAARIKIVAPDIEAEAYYTRFNGRITDYTMDKPRHYKFELGPKLDVLESYLKVPLITKAIWINAHDDAVGKPAPLVYGVHSSASLGSRGMLPTRYVDTIGFRYLLAHQHIESIENVYVDNIVQSSGWATSYINLDGNNYTLIDFTADQGDATITADATGAVFGGDRVTYNQIENPAEQFKYILTNYVFNSWDGRVGNWFDEDDAPIQDDLFTTAEQLLNSRGAKGSIAITEPTTGLQLVNLFASEYFPVFWTADAKLAIRTDDWYFTYDTWNASRTRLDENDFISDLTYKFTSDILADEWSVGFLYSEADGEPIRRLRVKDTIRNWDVKEEIDLKWTESSI